MKLTRFLNFILFATLAAAFSPIVTSANGQTIHILQVDPNFDANAMAGKKAVVDPIPSETDDPLTPMNPKDRDALFQKAKLDPKVFASWDNLDRDLFVARVRDWNLGSLHKRYPKIPIRQIDSLKTLLKTAPGSPQK